MKITGNTILITGGGSGIGLALAAAFVESGNRVLVCGRSERKLDAARRALPGLHTFGCDVSRASEQGALVDHVTDHFPALNVLINNAGVMRRLDLSNGGVTPDETLEEVTTNFLAPVELTHRLLPHLQRQERPAIINVSSGLAYVPMAASPVYSASKAALHSYTRSLRRQLGGTPVEVYEILPPTVDTAMAREFDTPKLEPKAFAEQVVKQLEQGLEEIRVGQTRALYLMSRVAPGVIYNALNRAH